MGRGGLVVADRELGGCRWGREKLLEGRGIRIVGYLNNKFFKGKEFKGRKLKGFS